MGSEMCIRDSTVIAGQPSIANETERGLLDLDAVDDKLEDSSDEPS